MSNPSRVQFGEEQSNPPWYLPPEGDLCPDCGVSQGELHQRGCDREQCPICKLQLIGCQHGDADFNRAEKSKP